MISARLSRRLAKHRSLVFPAPRKLPAEGRGLALETGRLNIAGSSRFFSSRGEDSNRGGAPTSSPEAMGVGSDSTDELVSQHYPFPLDGARHPPCDLDYPGTAVARLASCLLRVGSLPQTALDGEWDRVRESLLWAGGLQVVDATGHAFNDDNHCDLCTMLGDVQHNHNADGAVGAISRSNQLGPHIKAASDPDLGEGGSWSTCTNGCNSRPPHDVAHVQFQSRVAFKLVWCPPSFDRFVLVDDLGKLLRTGKPTGRLPHITYRKKNFALVQGGLYEAEPLNAGKS